MIQSEYKKFEFKDADVHTGEKFGAVANGIGKVIAGAAAVVGIAKGANDLYTKQEENKDEEDV